MKHYTKQLPITLAIAFAIGLLATSGCKKDHTAQMLPANKKYTVSYNVSAFSQQFGTQPLGTAPGRSVRAATTGDSLKKLIDLLYCAVYDTKGNFVTMVQQDSSQADFGHISTTLTAGTYWAIFVGGKNGIYYNEFGTLAGDYIFFTGANTGNSDWIVDSFFKRDTITVGPGNTTSNVTMNRVVAKVTITIQDQLPAAVDHLVINNLNESNAFAASSGINQNPSLETNMSYNIPAASRHKTNYTVSFLTASPNINLAIYAYAGSVSYAKAAVNNVATTDGQTTLVTGRLFGDGSSGPAFNVVADPSWNPAPINQSF